MRYLAFLPAVLIFTSVVGQKTKNQIEINPYIRWDKYPPFSYTINSISTNEVKIRGKSWGLNAFYKIKLPKQVFAKAGLGYYRYSFNTIENNNSVFGKSNKRVLKFPSPIDKVYVTDKYWYNTVAVNIGIEKWVPLKENLILTGSLNFNNFFTFSQYYHVTNAPTDIQSKDYKISDNRFFGFSTTINTALIKKIGKFSIGPSITFPIYDSWRQDVIFPQEENSKKRSKWLKGFGTGIIVIVH